MHYRGGRREKAEPFDHVVKLLVLGDSCSNRHTSAAATPAEPSACSSNSSNSKSSSSNSKSSSSNNSSSSSSNSSNSSSSSSSIMSVVDFKTKVVESGGRRIKLQVWDTAGQERFRTITPAYFRSAMGVMLVYDLTNAQTFHNIRRWMQNVEEFADPSIVRLLIANKLDLQAQRQVSRSKGEDLAREYDIPFFETSAKGNINVEEAFMCAANRIRDLRFSPGPLEPAAEPAASGPQQLTSSELTSRQEERRPLFTSAQRFPSPPCVHAPAEFVSLE
ncbi:hypothetical protein Emed_002045 [Eimeria media]